MVLDAKPSSHFLTSATLNKLIPITAINRRFDNNIIHAIEETMWKPSAGAWQSIPSMNKCLLINQSVSGADNFQH